MSAATTERVLFDRWIGRFCSVSGFRFVRRNTSTRRKFVVKHEKRRSIGSVVRIFDCLMKNNTLKKRAKYAMQ